ncbi:MAG: dockerin type I domain-containing protein [Porcipelethomonas sp.]
MRRFKITAASVNGVSAVSADSSYDNCDVDRDGRVSIADQLVISKYLAGVYSIANYNQLDTNQNLVVDYADAECILARLLGRTYSSAYLSRATGSTVSSPNISGFTPNSTASSTAGRTYMRYSYETGQQLSNYTLTPVIKDNPNMSY